MPNPSNAIPAATAPATAPPVNSASQPDAALANEKAKLEIQKLTEEIAAIHDSRNWRHMFFRSIKITEVFTTLATICTALAAIIALSITFHTGLFDAARQNLAAQGERLTIEKINLERRKEILTADVDAKTKELEDAKKKLLPFEQEEAAISELRELEKKKLGIRFLLAGKHEGIKVSVWGARLLPQDVLDPWSFSPTTERNPALADALRAANRVRVLKGLWIRKLFLTQDDLILATQHPALEQLLINYAELDSECSLTSTWAKGSRCSTFLATNLHLSGELPWTDFLTDLSLERNRIGDEGVKVLPEKCPNVQILDLSDTEVSDDALLHLAKLRELYSLNVKGTRVTGSGLLKLLDCPKLHLVRLDQGRVTGQVKAILQQKGAKFQVDTTELSREATASIALWKASRDGW